MVHESGVSSETPHHRREVRVHLLACSSSILLRRMPLLFQLRDIPYSRFSDFAGGFKLFLLLCNEPLGSYQRSPELGSLFVALSQRLQNSGETWFWKFGRSAVMVADTKQQGYSIIYINDWQSCLADHGHSKGIHKKVSADPCV